MARTAIRPAGVPIILTALLVASLARPATAAERTLTLTILGNGTVTKTPDQASYADSTIVQLDPVPGAGWSFSGWSGDTSGDANPLFVTMDADKNITAAFVDVLAPSVQVLAPNGGEILTVGGSFNITWTATDNDAVTTVDLAYSTDGGVTFPNPIATGIANTGSYGWTIPDDPSVAARVRVTAHDAAANAGFDDSNANFTIQAVVVNNTVNAVSPSQCLSTAHACVTVPVTIARDNAVDMRAYSVTITLSPELDLCSGAASITESTYLNSIAGTSFVVTSLGGNAYRVDGSIVGPVCGATAASGTLFNVSVKPAGADGTGAVTLGPVVLRDCASNDLPSSAGTAASVTIDRAPPAAVGSLAAAQQLSGNDTDGTTRIALSYSAPGDAVAVEVYRQGFGHYPEYDDAGGAPPAPPGYPPTGWTPVAGATLSGVTDEPATRDFWTYAVFAKDACDNVSVVSVTGGTLNYFLGDVSDGHTAGAGNNSVSDEDISLLGSNYGIGEASITTRGVEYLDVGPTTDLQPASRPTTDDRIDFEDLIVFAINYGQVSSPQRAARMAGAAAAAATGPEQFTLRVPALVEPGQVVGAELRLEGAGRLQGFSARLDWDPTVVEPLEMHSGQFIEAQHGVVLTPRPGTVDASLLGVRERGISGAGTVATVSFRVLRAGDAAIRLAQVTARDAANRAPGNAAVQQTTEAALPTVVELLPPMPNPARGPASLVLALPHAGPVELAVYSVDGRRVRTLVNETRAAGIHRIEWDGRDEARNGVAPGVYYAHLSAGGRRITRSMVRLR